MFENIRRAYEAFQWGRGVEPEPKPTERRYGDDKTIHRTGEVNVELHDGQVVAVWFRCQTLPFTQTEVDYNRARNLKGAMQQPRSETIKAIVFEAEE